MIRTMTKNEVNNCYRRIVILSNYRERCEKELWIRLVKKEKFDEDVFNYALDKAKKYNIVNDIRYAEIYTFCKTQSYRGTEGIKKHLESMNIDYKTIKTVVEILNKAQMNETQTAIDYINLHPSKAKDVFGANVRKLVNRGFSVSCSVKAVNLWLKKTSV